MLSPLRPVSCTIVPGTNIHLYVPAGVGRPMIVGVGVALRGRVAERHELRRACRRAARGAAS